MHNHFNQYLNVKGMIERYHPITVLEIGAGSGENTVLLYESLYPRGVMTIISDGERPEHLPTLNLWWIRGVGHLEMAKLPPQSVHMILIDSDHNYYTLQQELIQAHRVLCPNGLILMHDTTTYDHNSGSMSSYGCGVPYPAEEIRSCEAKGLMYGDALRSFMGAHPEYREVARSDESHGAVAIQRQ